MYIAMCEDNARDRFEISGILAKYREADSGFFFDVFSSAEELLHATKDHRYDALLLDVVMPGMSGIDVAKLIRENDSAVKIIFLTSSPEYAYQSYSVGAADYIIKPVTYEKMLDLIYTLKLELEREREAFVLYTKDSILAIPYYDIEFIEVFMKTLTIHMTDGSTKSVRGTLSDFADKFVTKTGFCVVHRSYIVNFRNMKELTKHQFVSRRGVNIPVARNYYKDVKEAYIKFLFGEAEV